jgi:hypothetical protein
MPPPNLDAVSVSIEEQHLDRVSPWFAGGLALLTVGLVLTGAATGVLDRMLGSHPRESALVFALFAFALLTGVTLPALRADQRIRFAVVLLVVAALTAFTLQVLPDQQADDSWIATWGVVVVLVVAALLLALFLDATLPIMAASLVIAVTALTLGTYGAVKLSAESRRLPAGTQVTATVTGAGVDRVVTVRVRAGGVDVSDQLELGVFQLDTEVRLGVARLLPDASGAITTTVRFPVANPAIAQLAVAARTCRRGPACALSLQRDQLLALDLAGTVDTTLPPPEVPPTTAP